MPLYQYKAKDLSGGEFTDNVEADTLQNALKKVQSLGYYPLRIEPFIEKRTLHKKFLASKKVTKSDLVIFTRKLADSLKAGLPLVKALLVIEKQTTHKKFKNIIQDIRESIEEGWSLSQAMKKHGIFPNMYIGMVEAGEKAGILDTVLERLAEFSEKEKDLRQRIQAVLIYPLIMLIVGSASVFFLLGFVIPRFELMFEDMGQLIPLPTQVLIFTSHVIRHYAWLYIPFGIAFILLAWKLCRTKKGNIFFSRLKLKIPLFGQFFQKEIVARCLKNLSILLSNGVPILDALTMARNAVGDKIAAREIDKLYEGVKEGRGLLDSVKSSSFFPPLVAEMIAVGEETGKMEEALLKSALAYEREVEYALKTITSLLEPLIILIAGIVVCFIALAMLLPVFQMSIGI